MQSLNLNKTETLIKTTMYVWIAVLLTVSACWGETASNEVWNVKRLSPRLSLQWKYDKDSIEMTVFLRIVNVFSIAND